MSVKILPCDGDSTEGSLALLATRECRRQWCNCHDIKCNLVSSSALLIFFFTQYALDCFALDFVLDLQ